MSTRSNVGIINVDNSVIAIYIHSDGYPSGVGETLLNHYNTERKVRDLLKLGDLSVLGEVIGEKHDFDWMNEYSFNRMDEIRADPRYKMCLAYGRDRGETGTKATKFSSTREACASLDNDYTYLYNVLNGRWSYRHGSGPFHPLTVEACAKD